MSQDKPALEFTGERFTPECVREIAYEHWHRYAWARALTQNKVVLDVACGEGYGSHFLAQSAQSVTGIDVDPATIEHAQARYQAPNLTFIQADALTLPIEDQSMDVVVCLETLEHLEDHDGLMEAFKRVLKPEGMLVLSSPDKASYSDEMGYANPFHAKELYREELESLLARHFAAYQLWAQKLIFSSTIWRLTKDSQATETRASYLTQQDSAINQSATPSYPPQYFLAVASMREEAITLPELSLFSDQAESVYQHYQAEIRHHMASGALLVEKEAEIARLREKLAGPWWQRLRSK